MMKRRWKENKASSQMQSQALWGTKPWGWAAWGRRRSWQKGQLEENWEMHQIACGRAEYGEKRECQLGVSTEHPWSRAPWASCTYTIPSLLTPSNHNMHPILDLVHIGCSGKMRKEKLVVQPSWLWCWRTHATWWMYGAAHGWLCCTGGVKCIFMMKATVLQQACTKKKECHSN